jgi:ribosome-binding protein aMBF1 (putative translation factor)
MPENLADALLRASSVMHWLEKYNLASTLNLLSRLLRAHGIDTLEALEAHVTEEEAKGEAPAGGKVWR